MIGIAICLLAIILVLGVATYISYENTEKQLKQLNETYLKLRKEVIEEIRENARYVNHEIDDVTVTFPNIFVDKVEVNNSENIYELSTIYTKTDIAAEKLKEEINRKQLSIVCLQEYKEKLNHTNDMIDDYNHSIVEINKIARTTFGNSLIEKYNLKNAEKIIV